MHYKTSNICAHIVAVGILTDNLHLFIDWYKRNNQSANITSLAQSGIPIGGKKPKKRKGVSKSQSKKISKKVENAKEDEWSHTITFSNVTMCSSVGSNNIVSIQSPQLNTLPLHNQSAIFPFSPYGIVPSLPSYPSPVPRNTCRTEDSSPFVLCFIQGNISTCFGCKQKYLKPLVPPHDLCIRHEEWRSFTVQNTPQSRYGNAYYHVNLSCVQTQWPLWNPYMLTIPQEVNVKLQEVHKQMLFATLGFSFVSSFSNVFHFLLFH